MNPTSLLLLVKIGAFALLAGGAVAIVHQHDNRVRANVAAVEAARVLDQERRDHAAALAALELRATLAEARAGRTAATQEAIHAAPPTFACFNSPAGRALVDGLRRNAGRNPGSAAHGPAYTVDVPGAAGASAGR